MMPSPHSGHRPLWLSATLGVAILGMPGCMSPTASTPRSDAPTATTPSPASTPAPAACVVASVAILEGQTVIELAALRQGALPAGTFLRITDSENQRHKGMIHVTGVARGRAMARVVALTDRKDPIISGDLASVVDDPSAPPPPLANAPTPASPIAGAAPISAEMLESLRRDLAQARADADRVRAQLDVALSASAALAVQVRERELRLDALTRQWREASERETIQRTEAQRLSALLSEREQRFNATHRELTSAHQRSASMAVALATAEEARVAADVARLAAERAAMELATRVLRASTSEAWSAVQGIVREQYAVRTTTEKP